MTLKESLKLIKDSSEFDGLDLPTIRIKMNSLAIATNQALENIEARLKVLERDQAYLAIDLENQLTCNCSCSC